MYFKDFFRKFKELGFSKLLISVFIILIAIVFLIATFKFFVYLFLSGGNEVYPSVEESPKKRALFFDYNYENIEKLRSKQVLTIEYDIEEAKRILLRLIKKYNATVVSHSESMNDFFQKNNVYSLNYKIKIRKEHYYDFEKELKAYFGENIVYLNNLFVYEEDYAKLEDEISSDLFDLFKEKEMYMKKIEQLESLYEETYSISEKIEIIKELRKLREQLNEIENKINKKNKILKKLRKQKNYVFLDIKIIEKDYLNLKKEFKNFKEEWVASFSDLIRTFNKVLIDLSLDLVNLLLKAFSFFIRAFLLIILALFIFRLSLKLIKKVWKI